MVRLELRLNCTGCKTFTEYEHDTDRNGNVKKNVVYCDECHKKHSHKSLYMVEPGRRYERDEAGNLLEDLP